MMWNRKIDEKSLGKNEYQGDYSNSKAAVIDDTVATHPNLLWHTATLLWYQNCSFMIAADSSVWVPRGTRGAGAGAGGGALVGSKTEPDWGPIWGLKDLLLLTWRAADATDFEIGLLSNPFLELSTPYRHRSRSELHSKMVELKGESRDKTSWPVLRLFNRVSTTITASTALPCKNGKNKKNEEIKKWKEVKKRTWCKIM